MTIDWNHFTPLPALLGGVLIGLAVAVFALWNGRIAGVSGIVGGLLRLRRGDITWRIAFVLGLLVAPLVYRLFASLPEIQVEAAPGMLVLSGLLVGVGTCYASGCTSGHGVCGMSRLSLRSVAATMVFMAAGFAMVFVMRHLLA